MGCSQSKASVAAPATPTTTNSGGGATAAATPKNRVAGETPIKRSNSNRSFHSKSSHRQQREDLISVGPASVPAVSSPDRKFKNTSTTSTTATTIINGGATVVSLPPPTDSQWKLLWQTLPHPVDPADVPAVISDLMARHTNMLLPTEVTLLQRRIRLLSKSLQQQQQQKKTGRLALRMSTEDARVEKQHTLDETVLRKLWKVSSTPSAVGEFAFRYSIPPATTTETATNVDLVGSALVLLQHLSEPLWERAAWIAVDSAQQAGLEMDVNKNSHAATASKKIPPPVPPLEQYAVDESLATGITFHSVCFLMALALRKYKHRDYYSH